MERFEDVVAVREARRQAKSKTRRFDPSDEPKGERFLVEETLRTTERKYWAVREDHTRLLDSLSLRNAEEEHESNVWERQQFLRNARRMGIATREDFKAKSEMPQGRIAGVVTYLRELREAMTRLAWEISELKYQLAEARRYRR